MNRFIEIINTGGETSLINVNLIIRVKDTKNGVIIHLPDGKWTQVKDKTYEEIKKSILSK